MFQVLVNPESESNPKSGSSLGQNLCLFSSLSSAPILSLESSFKSCLSHGPRSQIESRTCDIDRDDVSGDCLGLLPHSLLRCWKPGARLHLHINCWLVGGSEDIPAGGGVDGVEDQWGHRSHVVQDEPLVFI